MPKTIDDIIPPSRRRQMQDTIASPDTSNEPSDVPVSNSSPASTPNSYSHVYTPPSSSGNMSDMHTSSPVAGTPSNSTPLPPTPHMASIANRENLTTPMPPSLPPRVRIRTGRSFPYGTALIALVVIAVSAGALYAFAGAKVEITPNTQTVTVSGDYTATQGSGDLPFSVITINKTASSAVTAESTVTANDSAQGTITIMSTETSPQNLINNTRFETPSGLIFRIHAPVTVPPATASGPGTVTATVYADQAGQNYNVGPSSFTVPGLQNTPTYTEITAKSSMAMTGGFSGTRPSVSQSTDDSQHAALQTALATTLQAALATQIPSGDVVVPGGSTTTYTALPDTATSTNSVAISEQGTLTAFAFPENALAKAIAYKAVGTYSGEPVTLSSASTMTLSPEASTTDYANLSTLGFSLSGNATIVWVVDTTKIAGAVAGKTRDAAQNILSGFPEVDRAVLTLRPFWTNTFPQDPSHIHVTVDPVPASN